MRGVLVVEKENASNIFKEFFIKSSYQKIKDELKKNTIDAIIKEFLEFPYFL